MERGKEKERIDEICGVAREHGFEIEVKNLRVVGSYSPSKQKMGMELYVKPI
jgi:tRNA G37 N-methylase Trm5